MDVVHVRLVRMGGGAAAMATAAALVSCATSNSDAAGGPAALFRAQVGHPSEAVAPRLNSAWYVQRKPVQYAKVGLAGWRAADGGHGVGAWFGRLFGRRHAKAEAPLAVAALGLDLPAPSLVQVTSLATYKTVTVRVDDKARMRGQIIRLPTETAQALGAEPGKPLMVRLRYYAPVLAYKEPPTLRYALSGPMRRGPGAPATAFAARKRPAPTTVLAAAAAPPSAAVRTEPPLIRVAAVNAPAAPLLHPAVGEAAPKLRGQIRGETGVDAAPKELGEANRFRVQAGAFAKIANAERAAERLATAGKAAIVPIKRGSETLYRVVVFGPRDAAGAERLRARVAEIGFADARIVRPL